MKCPACEKQIKPKQIDEHGKYRIKLCPSCDVVFSDPMENPGADWYEKSEMYAASKEMPGQTGWHHEQFLSDSKSYGKLLLDVGCGTGFFLSKAQEKGYQVWGLDFDKGDVKIAREKYGIKNSYVKSISELSKDFSGQRFDIITLFEVLEHLDEPVQFLGQVKRVLKPGGHIAISVPNRDRAIDSLGDGDYPPNHLTKWNRQCLSAFLERNGFEVVKSSVKRLDDVEVSGYLKSRIRFGISKKMIRQGIDTKKQDNVKKAAKLLQFKDLFFKVLTMPLKPVLIALGLQGTNLYVLARLK